MTSEPIVSMNSPKICHRRIRSGSEGASPGSDTDSSPDEDEDEDDDTVSSNICLG